MADSKRDRLTLTTVTNLRAVTAILILSLCAAGWSADRKLSERFCLVHSDPEYLNKLGGAWNRYDFSWSGIERAKGVFDFRDLPQQVDESLRRDVKILPILDYEPAWDPEVSPADEETRDLWARYVQRTVSEFKGKLKVWQVWNEPNITFWKPAPNPRDYAELLRRSYLAAKAVDPSVQIVGVNCSDIDLEFTEEVFRYGGLNYCDILAYQPYRIAPEVGHFEEMQALRNLVSRYGEQKPIWFTEMGWNTDHFPYCDAKDLAAERPSRRQAAFLVRYMTIIQATGVEKIFWFAQGAGGHGIMDRKTGKDRAAFYAYKYLIDTLDESDSIRPVTPRGADGIYTCLFEGPRGPVMVAWSVNGPREFTLPHGAVPSEMRDMLGEPLPMPKENTVTLTGEPVYIHFDRVPGPIEERATLTITPAQIWLEPGAETEITLLWQPRDRTKTTKRITVYTPKGFKSDKKRIKVSPNTPATFKIKATPNTAPQRATLKLTSDTAEWNTELNCTPRKLWCYQGESNGYLTPSVLPAPDGSINLLIGAYDSPELLCLSAEGKRLWKYTAGQWINGSAMTGNINSNPESEIIFAMPGRQTLVALSNQGVLCWRKKIFGETTGDHPGWYWTHPALCDLNNDGEQEILYADIHGAVSCIDGSGESLWWKRVSGAPCDIPVCIANVCGGPEPEILAADKEGTLTCLSKDGEIVWKKELGSEITAAPIAVSFKPDTAPQLLVATYDEHLRCLDRDGSGLWSAELDGTMDLGSGIRTADLNGDGIQEIVASTRNHEVRAWDKDGTQLWCVETGAQIRSIPAIGDVDNDGAPEILIGSADWRLYCIDTGGQVEWTVNIGNRVDASPLLTDLNGDHVPDIVLPVRGGEIYAFTAAPDM